MWKHLPWWLSTLVLVACVAEPTVDGTGAAVTVPGPWVAPPRVAAIAASHFVPVVDPPPVEPAGSCSSSNPFTCSCTHPACIPAHPGTNELREYLLGRFGGIRNYGTYCCRQNSNRLSHLSVHAIGRAMDLGVPTIGGDADNTIGDEVANFLVEHAEYIGIQRVIWDYSFWNGERGFGSLGGNPHVDHLHVELSVDGAARRTLFFTRGAPGTTCTPECVGSRLIEADCASTDCGAIGAVCLDGPPRCGEPPPPEPPEAVRVTDAAFPEILPVGDPARLTFTGPTRRFDTRTAVGDTTFDAATNELTWTSGLPADVTGVWLNVAAIASEPGFVTAFATGTARPATSNINTSGRVRANLIPTPLGDGGAVTFYQVAPVDLVGDLYATMGATGDGLELVDPQRVYDSRAIGVPLAVDSITEIDVGAPAGATGVLGSVAVLRPAGDAHLAVFPCGVETESSTVNVLGSEIASNQILTALGTDGRICVRPRRHDMHVVVDVLGYSSAGGELEYQALTPTRLVDTRSGVYYQNRLGARQTIELPLGTAPGMPENGWAAVFNVATVDADGDGYVAAFACERGEAPGTSAHNFGTDVRATLVTSDLGTSRRACLTTSTRAHVIVDLLGIWRRGDGAAPPPPPPTPDPGTDPLPPETGVDGGVGFDGGMGPVTEAGCSCRAASGHAPAGGAPALFVAVTLGWLWRRRAVRER